MKKIFAILMVVTVLGSILAGCGSKPEEGATTGTTATTGGTAGTAGTTGETK